MLSALMDVKLPEYIYPKSIEMNSSIKKESKKNCTVLKEKSVYKSNIY